ncbi:unnamed protein product [Triticum turgidum subsp. durum]|uniref:Uncharacterized protein n=1 Tax=Triticum turgidum subsp. durum TaxID=4567 RepID=A0A9R1BTZ0_TRITD|nr:unnamed protein product [Triticum turgidum subsp. durum]
MFHPFSMQGNRFLNNNKNASQQIHIIRSTTAFRCVQTAFNYKLARVDGRTSGLLSCLYFLVIFGWARQESGGP